MRITSSRVSRITDFPSDNFFWQSLLLARSSDSPARARKQDNGIISHQVPLFFFSCSAVSFLLRVTEMSEFIFDNGAKVCCEWKAFGKCWKRRSRELSLPGACVREIYEMRWEACDKVCMGLFLFTGMFIDDFSMNKGFYKGLIWTFKVLEIQITFSTFLWDAASFRNETMSGNFERELCRREWKIRWVNFLLSLIFQFPRESRAFCLHSQSKSSKSRNICNFRNSPEFIH